MKHLNQAWTLGIDPAMVAAGYALYTPEGTYVESGVCGITEISNALTRLKEKHEIESVYLCIEDFPRVSAKVAGGHVARATAVTTAAARQIELIVKAMWPRKNEALRVKVNTWRKAVLGSAKQADPKAAAILACLFEGIKVKDHNEAEAVLIGRYGVGLKKVLVLVRNKLQSARVA